MTPDHLRELHAAAGDPPQSQVLTFIDDALRFYMEFHSQYDGFYGAFIHDALAVASALDPGLITTEALAVQVEPVVAGRPERPLPTGADCGADAKPHVAVSANVDAFFGRYIERVGNLATRLSNVAI